MPLFETVIQEKPPVVLEIGTAYTKLGFVSEAYPRFIIPTETYISTTGKIKKLFQYENITELYDQMVDFFLMIFFKHLAVSPKERKIVIVESVFCPTDIRETLAKVLFKHFEVSSISFVPIHLVALSTLAIESALVIDLGYEEVTLIPVYCGVQVLSAFQGQSYGGRAIHEEIKRQLLANQIKEEYLTEKVLEDIKVRTCFVTTSERAREFKETGKISRPCPDINYPINGKEIIKIPGILRETVYEILFTDDNDHLNLPNIILDSILKCPSDMRKLLCENLFLIGGTSMIIGLMSRIKNELLKLLDTDLYKTKLYIKSFKFHKSPSKENYTGWLGGSIYGGTDLVLTKSLTKEQYCKNLRVPDWVNLNDNRKADSYGI